MLYELTPKKPDDLMRARNFIVMCDNTDKAFVAMEHRGIPVLAEAHPCNPKLFARRKTAMPCGGNRWYVVVEYTSMYNAVFYSDKRLNELLRPIIDQIEELSELVAIAHAAGASTSLQNDHSPAVLIGNKGYTTEYTPKACKGFVEWVRDWVRRVRR